MAVVRQSRREDSSSWSDDASLVAASARGEMDAFAELYRRYAEQAWRAARRIADNEDDARDAVSEAFVKVLRMLRANPRPAEIDFGPYLLVAARHAAVDVARRKARVSPTRDTAALDSPTGFDQPGERALADEDGRLITQALAALPERERLALWLLEVEDKSLRTAAAVLGVKPNHVAQIAMRARKRLRNGYLQAHVRNHVTAACGFTVDHLAAYLDRELGHPSLKKVDEHVSGCTHCRQRLDELSDLGLTLRRALLFPSLLGARASKWWSHRRGGHLRFRRVARVLEPGSPDGPLDAGVLAAVPADLMQPAIAVATIAPGVTQAVGAAAPAVQHFVAAASATLVVLGLATLTGGTDPSAHSVVQQPSHDVPVGASPFEGLETPLVGQPLWAPIPEASGDGSTASSLIGDAPGGAPGPSAHAGLAGSTGPERANETLGQGNAPAGAPGQPARATPAGSTGLDPADETLVGGNGPAGAPGPSVDAGPAGSTGPERANETPAEGHAAGGAPGPPAHAGPSGSTGLDRANETPAQGHAPAGAPGPPAHAGPPARAAPSGSAGLDRANETPAQGHAPSGTPGPSQGGR